MNEKTLGLPKFRYYFALGSALICTPAWFLTNDRWFLISSLVTLGIISDLLVRVHDAIHYPGQFKIIEAQPRYPLNETHGT